MSDPRLDQLEDREAIRDLLYRYCYLIAAADTEAVIALFTPDCRVEVLGTLYEGPEGLRELYSGSLTVSPRPYVHNHLIDSLGDDEATARCVLEIRQTRDGVSETGGGCYEDTYRKCDGSWKFHTRTFRTY